MVPGYLSGAWGFRQELRAPPGLSRRALLALGAGGGALGADLAGADRLRAARALGAWPSPGARASDVR